MNRVTDEVWLQPVREALNEGVESLDAATLSRLNRARQQALAVRRKSPWQRLAWPLAGVSCAALLSVAVVPALRVSEPMADPLSAQTWEWLEDAPDADTADSIRFLLELDGALSS